MVKAPTAPAATIHQMCQINAKPIMVAKKAQTKPVGELRGISISRYSGSRSGLPWPVARCLNSHQASSPDTSGRNAKLKAGGGDAVSEWIAVALPELPEPERAALVTLLMDSLLENYDVEFKRYPSNELH